MLAIHTRENTFGDLTNRPVTRQSKVSKHTDLRDADFANRRVHKVPLGNHETKTPTHIRDSGEDGDENMRGQPQKTKDSSSLMPLSPDDKENIDPVNFPTFLVLSSESYADS